VLSIRGVKRALRDEKNSLMNEDNRNAPVLLYDGVCGLCNKAVQTVLDNDQRKTMRFAALQSDFGQRVVARHPELRGVDSVVYLEQINGEERVHVRSNAALKVASYLGGAWKLSLAARVIPRPLRDFLYNVVARYRYRFFGKYDTCMLPPQEARARFLDAA
jgi:predicted DCC family thiol-disulfide oxidoreductase YuxK